MVKILTQERELHAQQIKKELIAYQNKVGMSGRQIARITKVHYNSIYSFLEDKRHTYGRTLDKIEAFLKKNRSDSLS